MGEHLWRVESDTPSPSALAECDERSTEGGYRSLVRTVPDPVVHLDTRCRVVAVDDALLELTGREPDDVLGDHVSTLLSDVTVSSLEDEIRTQLDDRADAVGVLDGSVRHADGSSLACELRVNARTGDGEFAGVICVFRERERLAALDHLNSVVRAINAAIVEGSTRAEVERAACESLADAHTYEFAVVAEVDARTGDLRRRVEAGVDGFVEEIPHWTDPAGATPTGRAVRNQAVQVSTDVLDDPEFEAWHDDARKRGYRGAAVIPIVYDGTLYGILGVTTDRRNAFVGEERDVVGQLGELLGHAIASLERKRALMSDELIELEFVVPDIFDILSIPEATTEEIAFEGSVPLEDDEFLTYATTVPEAMPAVESLEDRAPHWESVTVLDESASAVRFEVHVSGPSMYSLVASLGGYIDECVIVDRDFVLSIHLPQGTEVRRVIEAVRDSYPNARNVARRQVERERLAPRELQRALVDELTDRQRTALEIAYHTGYFDWPRECSGEDLADRLDVSPATFHQHLRAAEGKLFDAVFE